MITRIRKLLTERLGVPEGGPDDDETTLRTVTAALMLEVARADFETDPDELATIERLITERFALPDAALRELLDIAHARVADAVSLHEFTRTVNEVLDEREKVQVLEMLWRVAYADGRVDKHEEHLVRRLADLLHLSHQDFIRTRLRVAEDSNGQDDGSS